MYVTVAGLFAYSFSVTDYSLDGFCTGVFFCPPPFYQVMRQNGLFEATCQICERTLTAIAGSLTSDQTAASAQKRIVQICSAPPAVDTEKCKAVVGGALTQVISKRHPLDDGVLNDAVIVGVANDEGGFGSQDILHRRRSMRPSPTNTVQISDLTGRRAQADGR